MAKNSALVLGLMVILVGAVVFFGFRLTGQEAIGQQEQIVQQGKLDKPQSWGIVTRDKQSDSFSQVATTFYAWETSVPDELIRNGDTTSASASTSLGKFTTGKAYTGVAFDSSYYGTPMEFSSSSQTPTETFTVDAISTSVDTELYDSAFNRIDSDANTTAFSMGTAPEDVVIKFKFNDTDSAFDLKGICFAITTGSNISEIKDAENKFAMSSNEPERLDINDNCDFYIESPSVVRISDKNGIGTYTMNLKVTPDGDGISNPETVTARAVDEQWFVSQVDTSIKKGVENDAVGTPSDVGAGDIVFSWVIQ